MLIESFLKYIRYELNLSAYTVLSYKTDLTQLCQFLTAHDDGVADMASATGDVPFWDVSSVTSNDIRAWIVARTKAGDSARTVRRKVQSVRAFYKYLMKRSLAVSSPAADVELAKIPKRLPNYVRQENLDALLDAPVDDDDFIEVRNRLIVLMFYTTGIRRAELLGLLDANVDTQSCELKVHGKRNKDRIIPFGSELADAINHYRQLRNELTEGVPTEMFFVRPTGEPLYPSLVYRVVHEMLSSVGGSDKFSPHVLRHTFASSMLNAGAQLNSVKELLGHESLATTQVYTHITFKELKDSYQKAHPRAKNHEKDK